ncbi:MAG: alpha/beta hydrolase [Acidobacteriaceae bacterium]
MASSQRNPRKENRQTVVSDAPEVVNPAWIAKAVGLMVVLALFCGYLTLCFLFYQGQWQLVLHPSNAVNATPASVGLAYENELFDVTETGQPRLTGWWVSAAPDAPYRSLTILYLHNGWGSLGDTIAQIQRLHDLGANVFAFDYRGFGKSQTVHPSEQKMYEDADAAWQYLIDTHHVPVNRIVLYGDRLGATIAAEAALRHPAAAVVLMSPFDSMLPLVLHDPRSQMVPVRLLFHNRFDLSSKIMQIKEAKLIGIDDDEKCGSGMLDANPPCPTPAAVHALYTRAAAPKAFFNAQSHAPIPASEPVDLQQFLQRFLQEYVPESTPAAK